MLGLWTSSPINRERENAARCWAFFLLATLPLVAAATAERFYPSVFRPGIVGNT
jgi:hypothetical protein